MSNFTKQLPNARAVSVVDSWLNACNIPHEIDNANIITIQGKDGTHTKVNLYTGGDFMEGAINGSAARLTDTDIAKAIGAFQIITNIAGYGKPVPVDRGSAPTRKLNYKKAEEFELVAFRHKEFRAAPNPKDEEILKYKRIYESLSQVFYRKNLRLCQSMSYDAKDIETYCKVWTVNFLHKYKVHNPTEDDNEKLLVRHLMQRLPELASLLQRKGRNVKGDSDPDAVLLASAEVPAEPPDEAWLERNKKIHNSSYSSRQKEARTILDDALSKLPHSTMVGLLESTAANTHAEPDARKEAAKRLKTHTAQCDTCLGAAQVNEKVVA